MHAVAERFDLRPSASAQGDRAPGYLDPIPVLVDELERASDQVGAVFVWGDPRLVHARGFTHEKTGESPYFLTILKIPLEVRK
jgi:hypothetical protein